jgi:hypothetical protein
MILSFELSMPSVNTHNGHWTGENKLFVKVVNLGNSQKAFAKAEPLLKQGYFTYDFGDGWRAGVSVKAVDAAESRKLRKKSVGFCGYDWMVDSILSKGKIETK